MKLEEKEIKLRLDKSVRIIIINILLYSVILIMPFIVVNISGPRYVIGKVWFLYAIAILLTISSLRFKWPKLSKVEVVALLFLLSIFVSVVFSDYRHIAMWGSYHRREGFIMWAIYVLLFILANRYLFVNKKMLNVILITACIMAIYSVLQFYGIDPIQKWALGQIKVANSFGTIGNRNFLSTYVCLFLFISMSIFVFYGEKKYLIYSTILFSALLCSLTRGGWLAFIIYSFIGLIFIVKRKKCLIRAILVFITFSYVFFVINITTDNSITGRADKSLIVTNEGNLNGSVSTRMNILIITWNAFCDKPLLGEGPDTLQYRLEEDYIYSISDHVNKYHERIDKAHNEFMDLAVNCGIVTIGLYVLLIILICIPIAKNYKDDRYKIIFLAIIGYIVQSFFNISVIMVAPLFWIFLGYCVKVNGFRNDDTFQLEIEKVQEFVV